MKEKICEIMGISTASYYRWKEDRKIIKMLEKYFTEEDLQEFIETGKISKLENNINNDKEMTEFIISTAILKLEKYNISIREYSGYPEEYSLFEDEIKTDSILNAVIWSIKNSNNAEEFIKNIKETTKMIEDQEEYSIMDENTITKLEAKKMIENKEEVIDKIEKMINDKLRHKLYRGKEEEIEPISININDLDLPKE